MDTLPQLLNHLTMPFIQKHDNALPIWWYNIPWKLGLTVYQLKYLHLHKLDLDHAKTDSSFCKEPSCPIHY